MKIKTKIKVFQPQKLLDLDSGFAGLLLIDLGQFNSHLLKVVVLIVKY